MKVVDGEKTEGASNVAVHLAEVFRYHFYTFFVAWPIHGHASINVIDPLEGNAMKHFNACSIL